MPYKPPLRHILRASKVHGKTEYHRGAEKEALRRAVDEMHDDNAQDLEELRQHFEDLERDLAWDDGFEEDYRYESELDFDSWEDYHDDFYDPWG